MKIFVIYEGIKNKYGEILESSVKRISLYKRIAERELKDFKRVNPYTLVDYWIEEEETEK